VRVSHASCEVAAKLFVQGPSLTDERPHRIADLSGISPRIRGDWTCRAGRRNNGFYAACAEGSKQVKFVFY